MTVQTDTVFGLQLYCVQTDTVGYNCTEYKLILCLGYNCTHLANTVMPFFFFFNVDSIYSFLLFSFFISFFHNFSFSIFKNNSAARYC